MRRILRVEFAASVLMVVWLYAWTVYCIVQAVSSAGL